MQVNGGSVPVQDSKAKHARSKVIRHQTIKLQNPSWPNGPKKEELIHCCESASPSLDQTLHDPMPHFSSRLLGMRQCSKIDGLHMSPMRLENSEKGLIHLLLRWTKTKKNTKNMKNEETPLGPQNISESPFLL